MAMSKQARTLVCKGHTEGEGGLGKGVMLWDSFQLCACAKKGASTLNVVCGCGVCGCDKNGKGVRGGGFCLGVEVAVGM